MESAFFHPKVVHIPLALGVLMPIISGGFLLAWWKGWFPSNTWLTVVLLQGLVLGTGMMASQSGEREEDVVESIVGHDAIHEHEEAAEAFVRVSAVVSVLSILAFRRREKKWGHSLAAATVALSVAGAGLAVYTGEEGGELVYEYGAGAAYASPDDAPGNLEEHDDD